MASISTLNESREEMAARYEKEISSLKAQLAAHVEKGNAEILDALEA